MKLLGLDPLFWIIIVAIIGGLTLQGGARENSGPWPERTPAQKNWIENLRHPTLGGCCSIADGFEVEADLRDDGNYWILLPADKFPKDREWVKVDAGNVLREPNPIGVPMAWVWRDSSHGMAIKVRCFVPSEAG